MESNEKQLCNTTKENQRLKTELEHLTGQLVNEKNARNSLENKLYNLRSPLGNVSIANLRKSDDDSCDNEEDCGEELIELKKELFTLQTALGQKDDLILEQAVQNKILQHELRVQKLENQLMFKRDEGNVNIFPEVCLKFYVVEGNNSFLTWQIF